VTVTAQNARAVVPEAPGPRPGKRDWEAIRAVVAKDMTAIRRSTAIMLPMVGVPFVLLVGLPAALAWFARTRTGPDLSDVLGRLPHGLADPITHLPQREQLLVLVNGYLLAPLFLIVPLMVSAVLAADAFAGEKERRTMESLLHLPVRDRDLFLAKVLVAFLPSVALSWGGFVIFALVSNVIGWPVVHRVFVPNGAWLAIIGWVAPAVAAFGLGTMVRISARAQTSQEANQLGGAVIMPVIILAVGQATGLLLLGLTTIFVAGLVIWLAAAWLIWGGMRRFTRDRIASRL
jgi:hypothetical protein